MKRVYACLLGEWIDITDTGLIHKRNPLTYINEEINNMFEYNYVNVEFEKKNYRIHPSLIQIVTD